MTRYLTYVCFENTTNNRQEILYLSIKNDFGNKLLYRCTGFLAPPSDIEKALDMIIDKKSEWDELLEEAMMNTVVDDSQKKEGK